MKNKKKEKGFTLIELLVVVAIIGILASVGVVAYNGYTESAKKAGVASNHANIMKFIGAELAKCNIDDTTMNGSLTCSTKSDAANNVANAARTAINLLTDQYINPYGGVVVNAATEEATKILKGQVTIFDDKSNVTIISCKSKDGCDDGSADRMKNVVAID